MAFVSHPAGAETPTATITLAGESLSAAGMQMYRVITRVFPDAPYMVYVANCESTGLFHWDDSGNLLPNTEGSNARGVFQVMMSVHEETMRQRNLNPRRLDDYMTYVRQLYDEQGVRPWKASRHCWGEHYRRLT